MHLQNIQQIVDEMSPLIVGRYLGKVFQMGRPAFAIDFGLRDGRFLFISVEPTAPRLYLIKRRIKDLEKQAMPHTQFAQVLSARLNGALLTDVTRDETERIIRFTLEAQYESGDTYTLLAQLTGRSANLFLLGPDGRINVEARTSKTEGQAPGDEYHSPAPQVTKGVEGVVLAQGDSDSLSAALDTHYRKLETEQSFQAVANELWRGGAEAMTLQKQRVVSTTGIKCVGNTVVLHGVRQRLITPASTLRNDPKSRVENQANPSAASTRALRSTCS